jgi:hypothetical protein
MDNLNNKYCKSVKQLQLREKLQNNAIKMAYEILEDYKKESDGVDHPPLGLVQIKK